MATAAVIGLNAGKRLLSSSFYYSDVTEKFLSVNDHCSSQQYHIASTRSGITAKKTSSSSSSPSSNYSPSLPSSSSRKTQSAKALKESLDAVASSVGSDKECEEDSYVVDDDLGYSVEALLLLQKSMLEKQWKLSFEKTTTSESSRKKRTTRKKITTVTCSGVSARQRRIGAKKKTIMTHVKAVSEVSSGKQVKSVINSGYVKGVISENVLSHAEVVRLSKKIKSGLRLDEHKSR